MVIDIPIAVPMNEKSNAKNRRKGHLKEEEEKIKILLIEKKKEENQSRQEEDAMTNILRAKTNIRKSRTKDLVKE